MDIDRATELARTYIASLSEETPPEYVLDHEDGIGERSWCFIFTYNSLGYVATGDLNSMRIGHGPIVIPKDGSTFPELGSADDIDEFLLNYERQRRIPPGDETDHPMKPEPAVLQYWRDHPGSAQPTGPSP